MAGKQNSISISGFTFQSHESKKKKKTKFSLLLFFLGQSQFTLIPLNNRK